MQQRHPETGNMIVWLLEQWRIFGIGIG